MKNPDKKIPSLWVEPTELINYFRPQDYAITETQITVFIKQFNRINHPAISEIVALLRATENFHNSTTLGYFKNLRDDSKTPDQLMIILNDISAALTIAETNCALKTTGSIAYQTLSDAITFSRECINHRLNELKSVGDKIYTLYIEKDNALRTYLQQHQPRLGPQ